MSNLSTNTKNSAAVSKNKPNIGGEATKIQAETKIQSNSIDSTNENNSQSQNGQSSENVQHKLHNKADEIRQEHQQLSLSTVAKKALHKGKLTQNIYDDCLVLGAASTSQYGDLWMLNDEQLPNIEFTEGELESILDCELNDLQLQLPASKKNSSRCLKASET